MRFKFIPTLTPEQIERFWSLVEVPYQPSCCWEWTGRLREGGYGVLYVAGHGQLSAHRVAWSILIGPPPDLPFDHRCRNHRCVNPDHVESVTDRVNALRGYGCAGVNARKTHCPRGHALTPDNIVKASPSRPVERKCRQCYLARKRKGDPSAYGVHPCAWCGTPFKRHRSTSRCCSTSCREREKHSRRPPRRKAQP